MRFLFVSIPALLMVGLGCGAGAPGEPTPGSDTPLGAISTALQFPAVPHDVVGVRFDIVASDATCDAPPLATKTIGLESEPLPPSVEGSGSGMHQFADGLFVLAPGSYKACATPLAMGGGASNDCAHAEAPVVVAANQTSEVVLVSQCKGTPTGGADIVVSLNDPPQISALTIDPSKFITVCQSATLSVAASDPNGDALTYAWSIVSGPAGSSLVATGATATFAPQVTGDYVLNVNVDDVHAARTNVSFPIHVSADATCAVPDAVQSIITAKCTPCHTTNPTPSGGLRMDTPSHTYTNLVGVNALGAGCTDRVRVVSGDSTTSYIIAKLRAAPGICGLPMPRNRPALPETEIATIEGWINSLPH